MYYLGKEQFASAASEIFKEKVKELIWSKVDISKMFGDFMKLHVNLIGLSMVASILTVPLLAVHRDDTRVDPKITDNVISDGVIRGMHHVEPQESAQNMQIPTVPLTL